MPKEQARDPGHTAHSSLGEGVCDEECALMEVTWAQLPSPGSELRGVRFGPG